MTIVSLVPSATSATLPIRAAYDQVLAEIRAVPDSLLMPITVDIPSTVTKALGAWREIRALREEISGLPKFDLAAFDKLETYALALAHANTRYLAASEPLAPLSELFDEAVKRRETLASDAQALAQRGLLNGQKLKDLKGAVGYKNVAQDLLTLAELVRANYPSLAGKTAVTVEELDRVEVLAYQVLDAVGERDQGPAVVAESNDLRQRAFALFGRTYEQARRAIAYLRFEQGDLDDIAPSLFARSGTRKRSESEEAPPEAPVAPGAGSAQGTSAQPPASAPVGLPGSDPFGRP